MATHQDRTTFVAEPPVNCQIGSRDSPLVGEKVKISAAAIIDKPAPKRVLVIEVGATSVDVVVSGKDERRSFRSRSNLKPRAMVAGVKQIVADWEYDVVSIGYPGAVLCDRPVGEPSDLASGWVGFDFARAFGRPVKVMNDSAMHALGSYKGGKMLFLRLGAGLGSTMITNGAIESMELGQLPYKKGTYEDYVGRGGLKRYGKKKWRRHVADVVSRLTAALQPDETVIGGISARKLMSLPPRARAGDNINGFFGGFRLWQDTQPS